MRARKGLLGSLGYGVLTGVSCLEVGVLDPSILKTERPPRYRAPISWLAYREPVAPPLTRSALPPKRVRSLTHSGYQSAAPKRATTVAVQR